MHQLHHRLSSVSHASTAISSLSATHDSMDFILSSPENLKEKASNDTVLFNALVDKIPVDILVHNLNPPVTSVATLRLVGSQAQ